MNYFIDFEATQFSGEIISVGCVREDGETFYVLVQPQKGKLTPFITNLTGITAGKEEGNSDLLWYFYVPEGKQLNDLFYDFKGSR